jgi:CRISPR/Cas system-associated exonuclease Cas4 (RecB family)
MKYTPYSASKIGTWASCPYKFKLQYIDKVPIPKVPRDYFDRGKLIHLFLEHEGDLKKVKDTPDYKEIVSNGLLTKEDIKNAYKSYKNFVNSNVGKQILKYPRLLAELPIGLNEELNYTHYDPGYKNDVVLRGFIDDIRTVPDRDDVLIVTDWKTGKYKTDEEQSWAQLLWYSIGMFTENKNLEKIVLIYAYIDSQKVNKKVVHKSELDKYKKALFDSIEKIENDEEFKKHESYLCGWCDFYEYCQGPSINK